MMTKENRLAWVMLSASAAWCVADPAGVAMAQSRQSRAPTEDPLRLEVLPVRGNVYLLHGAGANVTLSVGRDGVLLVDTGTAAAAARVVTTVRALATQVLASPVPAKLCVGLACDGGPAFPSYHATTGRRPQRRRFATSSTRAQIPTTREATRSSVSLARRWEADRVFASSRRCSLGAPRYTPMSACSGDYRTRTNRRQRGRRKRSPIASASISTARVFQAHPHRRRALKRRSDCSLPRL